MRVTRIAVRALLAAGGVVAALLLLEVTVRLARWAPLPVQVRALVRDEVIDFRFAPGSVRRGRSEHGEFRFTHAHNRLGFRDAEHAEARPPGTRRIVALGDSFTYGIGADYDDTYLVRLEAALNARPDAAPTEIIKLGLPRHYPALSRRVFAHVGRRFAPDVVLMAVLPNDVVDTALGPGAVCVTASGYLAPCDRPGWGAVPGWLAERSALARLAWRHWHGGQRAAAPSSDEALRPDGPFEPAWRRLEADLRALRDDVRAAGAAFVVVAIPNRGMVTGGAARADYAEERLRQWSAAHEVAFVPTLARLRAAAAAGQALYWPRDGHCTPAGYAVIAAAIADALAAQGLAP